MFYIYSPQRRVFSGSLEDLRRVEKITPAGSAYSAISPNDLDERPTTNEEAQYRVSTNALKQYDQMIQKKESREAVYHAYQVMSQPVTSLLASYTLQQAYEIFEQHPFQLMPIINEQRRLIASLPRRDLYHALLTAEDRYTTLKTTIDEAFINDEQQVISAAAVTEIRRISAVLVELKLDALTVVDESGYVVGIVSRTDVLKCVTADPPLSLWC